MTINKLRRGGRFTLANWPNKHGKLLDKTRGAALVHYEGENPVTISLGTEIDTMSVQIDDEIVKMKATADFKGEST